MPFITENIHELVNIYIRGGFLGIKRKPKPLSLFGTFNVGYYMPGAKGCARIK